MFAVTEPGATTQDAEATAASYDAAARTLFVALARLSRTLRKEAPAMLGHSSVATLATIVSSGPMRPGDLADREGVSAPTMTRVVAGLVAAGYVVREPDPDDGRASLVRATEQGHQMISGSRSARSQVLRERIAALDPAQRDALLTALPALHALTDRD